jgi:hypothetical protein
MLKKLIFINLIVPIIMFKEVKEMTNEFKERLNNSNERIYRKLMYFYEKKISVHFCLVNGPGWKNGIIKELKEGGDYTMVFNEFKEGELYFLLEEININSIRPYKKPEELAKMKGG